MGNLNRRGLWTTGLLVGLFGAGLALGLARPTLIEDPAIRGLRGCVQAVGEDVAEDRVEEVWERLAPDTRKQLSGSHEIVLRGTADYVARRASDPSAESAVRMLEREYGMAVDALARTTPRDLWTQRIRNRLRDSRDRALFDSLDIERLETDGVRARVWAVLPDGRPQGMHWERTDGKWWLVDFIPFGTLERMERPIPRVAATPAPASAAR